MSTKRKPLAWPRTQGRYIRTDAGNVAHVQVAENITRDEMDMVARLVDAAYKYAEKRETQEPK